MKLFKRLSTLGRRVPKRALAAVFTLAVFALPVIAIAGWGPDRSVYDWTNPAQREGSFDGPRMNAYINTESFGDERAFFDARRTDQGCDQSYDPVQYPSSGTKRVILRTYIHNAAHPSTNASGLGVARDAKVRVELPKDTSHFQTAKSFVSISNPAPNYPGTVTDTVDLHDSRAFGVRYVPGSARIFTGTHPSDRVCKDGTTGGGIPLPNGDNIITANGVNIGHDQMNGVVPGCFEYQASVEITVEIELPKTDFVKEVRKKGEKQPNGEPVAYAEFARVKPGETTEWRIKFQNVSPTKVDEVLINDQLPKHLRVVPDSARWTYRGQNGQDETVKLGDNTEFFSKFIRFGESWRQNGGFYIYFDTVALDDFSECVITVRNFAHMKNKQMPESIHDSADVVITKENCVPTQPVFRCDSLSAVAVAGKDRTFKFTTNATAQNGAAIRRYFYNFGDNTPELVTDQNMVEHQYATTGNFPVSVKVEFRVNNQDQTVTSDACKVNISFQVQPAVTTLPVTGPTELFGVFAATSAVGAVGYQIVIRRRSL